MKKNTFFLITAVLTAVSVPAPADDIFILPCVYRVELTVRNLTAEETRTDFARAGSHVVGSDILYFRTWAEFDISPLKGKKTAGLGLAVYNEWAGTKISMLKYTSVRPSVSNQYQLLAQHNLALNLYVNFSWTINAGNSWTPSQEFYTPDWNNHRRYGNQNTVIDDLQAHIDDPSKTWFALEFSYNGSGRANLRFPSDIYNPASVLLAVITESAFSDTKNQGDGGGSCEAKPSAGEPINFSTGNEHFTDKDFILTGPGLPLSYVRHYNSRSRQSGYIGYGWTGSFSEHLTAETGRIILTQADGGEVYFDDDGQGKYISEAYTARVIVPDGSGGHILTEPDGKTLLFGGGGKLTRIRDRNGNTQNIFYTAGKPSYIEDNFGRRIELAYNTDGFLETLTTPAGIFTYTYDTQGNITGVVKPDMTVKTYCYTDMNDPHNLTEAENENGSVYRFEYDAQDRAALSESAGMNRITVNYQGGTSRKITDSLGRETVFELQASKGIGKVKSVTGAGCGQCISPSGGKYTLNNRVQTEQSEDAEGNITKYTYDSRGGVLTKTDAFGTPQQRTVTYSWHPQYSLVASVTRESIPYPGQNSVTSFTYDTTGNLRQKTENGYSGTAPVSRTTSFDYNAYGQITFIDGPRTDVSDTLSFEYYPNEAGQGLNRGMLKKITDAAGHETRFSQYNAWAKPCQITDINGVATDFTYDVMGRMKTKTSAGLTTSYDYDNAGNLTAVHLPGGRNIFYTYTPADMIEKIQDNEGNYIKYFYDTEGSRTKQEIHDKNGVLKQFTDYEPDDYNRLKKIIYPGGAYEEYGYDGNDSLTQARDAKGEITAYTYDALNRLSAVTQPGNRDTDMTGMTI